MARPIPCDNADDRLAEYMITTTADGSTFAVCADCWMTLAVATVAAAHPDWITLPEATTPAPIDPPADPTDPDNDVLQSDAVTVNLPGVLGGDDQLADQDDGPAQWAATVAAIPSDDQGDPVWVPDVVAESDGFTTGRTE